MADSVFLTPVPGTDPCGPDLRWEPEFLALNDTFNTVAQGDTAAVDGETVTGDEKAFSEVVEQATAISAKTKDIRVLAVYAEASWHQGGLGAFADAMETLAAVQETWPEGADGVHPRADAFDGDLGERTAAIGRLLNRIPRLAATIGWGRTKSDAERLAAATALKGVFGSWSARFEAAFGVDLPSSGEVWRALQNVVGVLRAPEAEADQADDEVALSHAVDAWDMIDQALNRMIEQDHHSPALPMLRLVSSWRTLGLIDIADRMRPSGVTLEQLLNSIKQQTQS